MVCIPFAQLEEQEQNTNETIVLVERRARTVALNKSYFAAARDRAIQRLKTKFGQCCHPCEKSLATVTEQIFGELVRKVAVQVHTYFICLIN